jgi:hypothetical protein
LFISELPHPPKTLELAYFYMIALLLIGMDSQIYDTFPKHALISQLLFHAIIGYKQNSYFIQYKVIARIHLK